MNFELRALGASEFALAGRDPIAGTQLNGAVLPDADFIIHADFAPVSGDFLIPALVQDAWSSPSGGEAGLVPVYAGDAP